MNKKGQAVWIGAIMALFLFFIFILSVPILLQFIAYGKSQIDQPFVGFLLDFIPFFLFIMLFYIVVKVMRSE